MRQTNPQSGPVPRFEIAERDASVAGCRVVAVHGELDLAVAPRLDELLSRAVEEHREVLVDLSDCQFIDSSGIAVIIKAHKAMGEAGKRLAVYAPVAQVQRVLSMTGLTANDLVFDSEAEALAASGAS
jgi:anti-sigma B factor antagonist